MTPQQALEAELKGLEESLLIPDIRKSTQIVELLADKFIEFGSSGRVYAKDDLVAEIERQVADGFPSGNRDPSHVAMPGTATSSRRDCRCG